MKMVATKTNFGLLAVGAILALTSARTDGHTDFPDLLLVDPSKGDKNNVPDTNNGPPNGTIRPGQSAWPGDVPGVIHLPPSGDEGGDLSNIFEAPSAPFDVPFPPIPTLGPWLSPPIINGPGGLPIPNFGSAPTPGAAAIFGVGACLGLVRRRR